ncbi:MAG: hypothetical protein HN507_04750, partial [Flavobacteriaceae bacterium]|nr:hypothetical protein [Flavobacteriaceae bacterium]
KKLFKPIISKIRKIKYEIKKFITSGTTLSDFPTNRGNKKTKESAILTSVKTKKIEYTFSLPFPTL